MDRQNLTLLTDLYELTMMQVLGSLTGIFFPIWQTFIFPVIFTPSRKVL